MTPYIALQFARLCADDCGVLWDMRLSRICPRCGSAMGLCVSRYLNKPAQPVEPPPVKKERRA